MDLLLFMIRPLHGNLKHLPQYITLVFDVNYWHQWQVPRLTMYGNNWSHSLLQVQP